RQVENFELAHAQRAELGDRWCEHLHRAELQRFHLLAVLVQGAVRVDLDLDAPLGALFGKLLEILGGLALGGIERDDVAELDDDRLLRERAAGKREQNRGGNGEKETWLHRFLQERTTGALARLFCGSFSPGARALSIQARRPDAAGKDYAIALDRGLTAIKPSAGAATRGATRARRAAPGIPAR